MSFDQLGETAEPVARKEHTCHWCGESILRGEQYRRYSAIFDGEFQDTKMHKECYAAMLDDEGVAYDNEFLPFGNERPKVTT